MIPVASPHPPGIIGVTAGELARYTLFTAAWGGVYVPADTSQVFCLGYSTASNSNDIIKALWAKGEDGAPLYPDAQWVWIMDDDHLFPPETLLRLLDRRVDVVVPLYTQRQPPFYPCIFKAETDDGLFEIFRWEDLEGHAGLLPVTSAGKGGVLIRRHVLEKLNYPWFEHRGHIGEDHMFFKKCREAGFTVYADLDTHLDHLTPVTVRPHRDAPSGRWCGAVELKRGVSVEMWSDTYRPGGMGALGADAVNAVKESA